PVGVARRAPLLQVAVVRLPRPAAAPVQQVAAECAAEEQHQPEHDDRGDDPAAAAADRERDGEPAAADAAPAGGSADVVDLAGVQVGVLVELHGAPITEAGRCRPWYPSIEVGNPVAVRSGPQDRL